MDSESLKCDRCKKRIQEGHVYLRSSKRSLIVTASVKCEKCFKKTQVEDIVKSIEGVLGQ